MQPLERMQAEFEKMDKNGCGLITVEDLAIMVHPALPIVRLLGKNEQEKSVTEIRGEQGRGEEG